MRKILSRYKHFKVLFNNLSISWWERSYSRTKWLAGVQVPDFLICNYVIQILDSFYRLLKVSTQKGIVPNVCCLITSSLIEQPSANSEIRSLLNIELHYCKQRHTSSHDKRSFELVGWKDDNKWRDHERPSNYWTSAAMGGTLAALLAYMISTTRSQEGIYIYIYFVHLFIC